MLVALKKNITTIATLLTLSLPACQHGGTSGLTAEETYFIHEVKPLLEARCLPCHNGNVVLGGLNLTSAATAFENRAAGPLIVPGHPRQSKFLSVILADESHPQAMPPTGHGLNEIHILTLEKWIREGAVWPGGSPGQLKPAPGAEPRSVDAHVSAITPIS